MFIGLLLLLKLLHRVLCSVLFLSVVKNVMRKYLCCEMLCLHAEAYIRGVGGGGILVRRSNRLSVAACKCFQACCTPEETNMNGIY